MATAFVRIAFPAQPGFEPLAPADMFGNVQTRCALSVRWLSKLLVHPVVQPTRRVSYTRDDTVINRDSNNRGLSFFFHVEA
jgi:hypothetical protein